MSWRLAFLTSTITTAQLDCAARISIPALSSRTRSWLQVRSLRQGNASPERGCAGPALATVARRSHTPAGAASLEDAARCFSLGCCLSEESRGKLVLSLLLPHYDPLDPLSFYAPLSCYASLYRCVFFPRLPRGKKNGGPLQTPRAASGRGSAPCLRVILRSCLPPHREESYSFCSSPNSSRTEHNSFWLVRGLERTSLHVSSVC